MRRRRIENQEDAQRRDGEREHERGSPAPCYGHPQVHENRRTRGVRRGA